MQDADTLPPDNGLPSDKVYVDAELLRSLVARVERIDTTLELLEHRYQELQSTVDSLTELQLGIDARLKEVIRLLTKG